MPKKQLLLVVEGDHNDADYIVSVTPITEKELKKFEPLIKAIKKFKPYKGYSDTEGTRTRGEKPLEWTHDHNWGVGDYCYRPDLGAKSITEIYSDIAPEIVEEFDENYVPHAEGNCHTIEAIFVVEQGKELFRRR
jgi:hypothetical protein